MGTSDDIVREQLARLFNSLASASCGRGYLSQATPIIQALLHTMYGENEDTHTLRNALGALQKLSLRLETHHCIYQYRYSTAHQKCYKQLREC